MGADTIFHGGPIVTMDRDQMQVEAVAISKGKYSPLDLGKP